MKQTRNDFDIIAHYDQREAEIQRVLSSIQQTHSQRTYNDVAIAFNRELTAIAKRRQLFGQLPTWADESEEAPVQQNRHYTITVQPRTLASYFEEEESPKE